MKQTFFTGIFCMALSLDATTTQPGQELTNTDETPVSEPPAAVVQEPTEEAAPYLELAMERIMAYEQLATVLDAVKDKLTADAAVADTQLIIQQLAILMEKETQLPAPTPAVEAYVQRKLMEVDIEELSERSIGKIIELLAQTDPPCYGSRELTKMLKTFTDGIMAAM